MLEITLKQLEAFVAVADCGSFYDAAQRLYLSQPTVSSHIAALEQHVGAVLLERGSRKKVTLTETGREVYRSAAAILARCRELEAGFSPQRGELRIGASTIPMGYLLPPILSAFQKAHPGCHFLLLRGDSGAVHEMLAAGTVQLGVVGTELDRENLVYRKFASDELVLVTPNTPEYRDLRRSGVLGAELLDRPLVARTVGSGTQNAVDRWLAACRPEKAQPKILARVESNEGVLELVSQGMGNAVLSSLAAAAWAEREKVLIFPLEKKPVTRDLFLAWPKQGSLTPLAQSLIDYLLAS